VDEKTKIEVLKILRTIAQRTCKRCIRTYEIPISVMIDEIDKELRSRSAANRRRVRDRPPKTH